MQVLEGSVGLKEGIECRIGHACVPSCAPIGYGLAVDDTSFSYLVQLPPIESIGMEASTHPGVQNCTGRRILSLCTWR